MKLSAFVALLAGIPALCVLGGQVPVVHGVVGGVPSSLSTRELSSSLVTATTPGKLRVTENSGICETTPGVYQASGYGDLTSTESIWFWFFAARNNPDTAPLVLWFNGGPGSSSMIGLFQEHGPCRITNDSSSVTLNKYSWNNAANVLYIDQPVGTGFSYGDTKVGTSEEAASDIWNFLQIFLTDSRFQKYAKNSLGLWTESYGGHYGPTFANHFLEQNAAIQDGKITGVILNLEYLGIGDGLTDPITQYPGYISYAASNPYYPLVNNSVLEQGNASYTESGGCRDQIISCNNGGSNSVCSSAQGFCNDNVLSPLAGDYDFYYVLTKNPDPYPPNITDYINSVRSEIGAKPEWQETSVVVYDNFAATGDWIRTKKPYLERVINTGVRTLIYTGDVDYIVNYQGVEAMIDSLETYFSVLYNAEPFSDYTVNGVKTGQYKNAGTFSYVRIYGAGHEVPAYKYGSLDYGQAAFQFFSQIMSDNGLSST